jgi:hypothetical protein
MREWCNQRPDNPSCKCVLRAQQPDWQKFAQYSASNAGCWYRPCAAGVSSGGSLVEYGVRHAQDTNNCPDICQSIINVLDSGDVTLDDVTQTTVCPASGGGGGGGGGGTTPNWQTWLLYGLAGVVGTAMVVGGGFLVYKQFAKKK